MKWPLVSRAAHERALQAERSAREDESRLAKATVDEYRDLLDLARRRFAQYVTLVDWEVEKTLRQVVYPALRERGAQVLELVDKLGAFDRRMRAGFRDYYDLVAAGVEVENQDSSATADPFFVVEERERLYGFDDERFDGEHVWVREDEMDVEADPEESARLEEEYQRTGDRESAGWQRIGYVDRWRRSQFFLTRKAAEEFMRDQRHNLRDPRIYVDSAHKNREVRMLRAILRDAAQFAYDARSRQQESSP